MIVGIILAAGKGTRIKSKDKNKVTLPFLNKPLIIYSVELMEKVTNKVIVVIGAFHQSVRQVLKNKDIFFAYQKKRLGTGHAVAVGLEEINKRNWQPSEVLVGYGDHTMFYKPERVKQLINLHKQNKAAASLLTFKYDDPNRIKYGRIIRDKHHFIIGIVEQKDATPEQLRIKEVNPGFYCFNYLFLKNNIKKLVKSKVSNEYYITDMVKIAVDQRKKVVGLRVGLNEAGLGINTAEELKESEKIYLQIRQ
jgi:bifunctional UDP-N-acetylglucosamine pyrophosphorylase/glucosamine-1-phosphate N-acetyltransferase